MIRLRAPGTAALAATVFLVAGNGAEAALRRHAGTSPELVPVEVVTVTASGGRPVVILRQAGGTRAVGLAIGHPEAEAIWMKLGGVEADRPLAPDLMQAMMHATGLSLDAALITGVRDGTYLAELRCRSGFREIVLDSRPSDAIALALRCRRPILMARALLDSADALDLAAVRAQPVMYGGLTLQVMTPDLAGRLGLAGTAGVVVADVRPGRFAAALHRGDVLVKVGGHGVLDAFDAAVNLHRTAGRPAALIVRRGGRPVTVFIPAGDPGP